MRKANRVYILFCAFKMLKMIELPTDCEIWSVIRFLNVRNVKQADIHHQICEVYSEYAMCDGMVRKWVRKFNEGCDNVNDEPCSGWPFVVCVVFTGGHVLSGGGGGYKKW
jgi:hypothetical protein